MSLIVIWLAMGTAMILFRRSWARDIKRSQAFWFDRTYDEDGLAWWMGATGGLVIAFGLVFLGIWIFN